MKFHSSMTFCNQGLQIALEWMRHSGCVLVCCCFSVLSRAELSRADMRIARRRRRGGKRSGSAQPCGKEKKNVVKTREGDERS